MYVMNILKFMMKIKKGVFHNGNAGEGFFAGW